MSDENELFHIFFSRYYLRKKNY